jgi:hypothetical protein
MARMARAVVEGVAHHVTQRGNRRQTVFLSDDYRLYRSLLAKGCANADVAVWVYCLMPNPVHLMRGRRRTGRARALVAGLDDALATAAPASRTLKQLGSCLSGEAQDDFRTGSECQIFERWPMVEKFLPIFQFKLLTPNNGPSQTMVIALFLIRKPVALPQ